MSRKTEMLGMVGFIGLLTAISAVVRPAQAQIYRWDNGELILGTDSITPRPRVDLSDWNTADHNLQYADLAGRDLSIALFRSSWLDGGRLSGASLLAADFCDASLVNANLSGTDLRLAYLGGAWLSNADLADAVITFSDFRGTTSKGFVKEQLYSTASYRL